MTVMNEALRLFLAVTALILTAMLAGPADEMKTEKKQTVAQERLEKPIKIAKYSVRPRNNIAKR